MATHASFTDRSTTAGADLILSLVDIATKLASNSDPEERVKGIRKDDIIPHFTRWCSFSVEQKAKIIDLVLDCYDTNLGNPMNDPSASTDASFIASSHLRKLSSSFSSQLMEGMALLREKSEDMLIFSFALNVDKLSSFGKDSRELTKYIEYRIPSLYRDNAALHEYCRLFANAIAATVLERANLTPFRRNYSGSFRTSYQPFTLHPGAPLPHLVDCVEITRPPLEIEPAGEDADPNLAPTAPNTPATSQRKLGLRRSESSYWAGEDDLDFSSEEVLRALDEAELRAGARVWKRQSPVRPVATDSKTASGSDVDSMLESISTASDLTSTITGPGSSDGSDHRVSGIRYPAPIGAAHRVLPVMEASVPPHNATLTSASRRVNSPIAHTSSPAPQTLSQQLGLTVPSGYMLIAMPTTPSRGDSTAVPPHDHATSPSLHNRTTRPPVMGSMVASGSNLNQDNANQNAAFPNPSVSPFGHQTDIQDAATPMKSRKKTHRRHRRVGSGNMGM